jgi:uncharacterized protein (TIGR03086 family)
MDRETVALGRAMELFGRYVAQIEDDQWTESTPNEEWSVHDLVKHNLESVLWVPDILAGHSPQEVSEVHNGNIMGRNPRLSYAQAVERARTAADRVVNQLHRPVQVSSGAVPARDYLRHQTINLTIHSWDLARGIGADEQLDPALIRVVWRWFQPQAEAWRAAGLLGEEVPLGGQPDLQTRLLALSGRHA